MAQQLLSIALGTTSAKLSEVALAGKKVRVFSAYDIPLQDGLCEDGTIVDVEALAAELKGYISKYRIKTKKLVFSIASKRIASKEVVIPYVKEKQIPSILEINASEYFPVANINEYTLNYSIVELVKNAETTQYRMNVIAVPSNLLKGYYDLATAMKMQIETIDYAGNAILQVLKSQSVSDEISAILQLGYENTVINLMNGKTQIMQRSVTYGLGALVNAVCESVGLDDEDAIAFLEDNDISRICSAYPDVKYVVDNLISSIGRIFEFYNSRSADHRITSVRFIGDATLVNGMGDVLEQGLGYSVEEILTLNNVEVKKKGLTPEFATNFMANIGAVIAPMNIKYEEVSDKKASKADDKLPIWSIVLAVIASIIMFASTFVIYNISDKKVVALREQAESLAPMRQLESKLSETVALADSIAGFYDSTKAPNDEIGRLIGDLEKIVPTDMSIDTLLIDAGNVSLSGTGVGKKGVAKFIVELKELNYVDDIRVDFVSETNEDVQTLDAFNMSFTLNYVEETEASLDNNSEETEGDTDIEVVNMEGGQQ